MGCFGKIMTSGKARGAKGGLERKRLALNGSLLLIESAYRVRKRQRLEPLYRDAEPGETMPDKDETGEAHHEQAHSGRLRDCDQLVETHTNAVSGDPIPSQPPISRV